LTKLRELIDWFSCKNSALIALSGGVDSALVAYAAFKKLGKKANAITANYKTLSHDELISAKKISSEIGIKHVIINYDELAIDNFVKNDRNRCFYCRSELSRHLRKYAHDYGFETIVDGTNIDDLGEYRPGIKAVHENGILSPLVETNFTKSQIRMEAKNVSLSIYDRPSNSCLASRIPWGQRISRERLTRIEMGETIVKQTIGDKQIRVRDINGTAKIEIDPNELWLLSDHKKLQQIKAKLYQIGFFSVVIDPEGYRPGKINLLAD